MSRTSRLISVAVLAHVRVAGSRALFYFAPHVLVIARRINGEEIEARERKRRVAAIASIQLTKARGLGRGHRQIGGDLRGD